MEEVAAAHEENTQVCRSSEFSQNFPVIFPDISQMVSILLNMLPEETAKKVLNHDSEDVQFLTPKSDMSVLVLDIVGFTSMSSRHSAEDLVDFLNEIYSEMDHLCDKYGLEKVNRQSTITSNNDLTSDRSELWVTVIYVPET